MIAISVNSLNKSYNNFKAVNDISFEVKKGEVFGFLGPNGAGKTTTLRMLTGLLIPDSGSATVGGYDITSAIEKVKESIGFVPETSNPYSEMTAMENLLFTAEIYGIPSSEHLMRAKTLLEKFGLYEKRDVKTKKFSRGMKRRLIIAMALIHEPSMLFLDEPTTGLDVQSARYIRQLIRSLRDKGVTVFLTTHYIEEADQLCDHIAIIHTGKIIADDTPEALKSTVQSGSVVEIAFDKNPQGLSEKLHSAGKVESIERIGDKYRLLSGDVSSVIDSLLNFTRERGLKIISLNTLKPTLEEAFIRITGLKHGVMESEKPEAGGGKGAMG